LDPDPDPHGGAGFHAGGVDGGVKDSRIPGTLRLVSEAHRSLGRTALCLSGGGALAMYHFG
jgi:TAG lipase/steryl ester hydrolase/phospholipase A2/LPA acyltransferase